MNKIAGWKSFQVILGILVVSGGITACGEDKVPGTAPGASVSTANSSTDVKNGLPQYMPKSPGPYTTMMVGDIEMKVGRYPVGQPGDALLRSLVASDPKTFNPWAANDTASSELASLMFSGPIAMDPYSGEMIPDLAESFSVAPDGVTYTTKLRKGLKWSDGKPITADDVAFTWNTIVAGGYGNSSIRDSVSVEGKMPVVTVVDSLTNKYVTPKPFAPFKRDLGMPIAPKHIIEPILKGKNGREAFQKLWSVTLDPSNLVVSGPFVLSRYSPAQQLEFVPNNAYAAVNKNKKALPYLSRVMFQMVPDVNTNLLKFRAKELDITAVRAKDLADLLPSQSEDNFKIYNLGPANGSTFLMFNLNTRKNPKSNKPYVDPIKSAWFNDQNFRQAVNHVIKRQEIIQNYFKGVGSEQFGSFGENSPWFDRNLKPFKPDLAYVSELLSKSGFVKKEDGLLYDKSGNKVEFTLNLMSGSTFYEAMANIISEDLKKVGITADLQAVNFNVLNDKIGNSLDWECSLMSLGAGDPLEPNSGANIFKSDSRMHMFDQRVPDKDGNIKVTDARPWEKRLDDLFNQGAEAMDTTKRHQIYDEAQQIIYDEAPFIYLVTPLNLIGCRNTVKNFDPTPLSAEVSGLHNIDEIWKKER